MSDTRLTILKNGLRIITDDVHEGHSVALGIWSHVGTRDEVKTANGAAHMVEHMLFKGTKRRGPKDIAEVIENVGGSMNAYTSREITSYHVHLLREDMPLALDVLADMYQNSTLPPDEIEREREVILQEIGMCNDTPDDLIFDSYYNAVYADQCFGAPILGDHTTIAAMPREVLVEHIKNFYTPKNTVISLAGSVDHDSFVEAVEKAFESLPQDKNLAKKKPLYTPANHRQEKDLEQAHFILGFEGPSRHDEDYFSAQAVSVILGGGMSSRLFQEIREKRGLVYSIYSFLSAYADTGQFGIYAGTGPDKLSEIIPVVCDELLNFSETLTEDEVVRAKSVLKAGLLMGQESMMNRADLQAKHVIYRNQNFDIHGVIKKIEAISLESIKHCAGTIFNPRLSIAALGPIKSLESYESIQKRF